MDYPLIMAELVELAGKSADEVPVAAAIFDDSGSMLFASTNLTITNQDPTAHAEILVMRGASQMLDSWRLDKCTLFVTLEPCVMCAGAIKSAGIQRVVFGAWDERVGGGGSRYDILRDSRLGRETEVIGGVLAEGCSSILQNFFKDKR